MKKGQKAGFLHPISSNNTPTVHQRRKRKGGKERAMNALSVFIIANLEIVVAAKTFFYGRGLFGANVFKNPPRYIAISRRLSEKVHATIPKGTLGDFEFTVFQRNFKEWHERPQTYVSSAKGKQQK